MQIALGLYARLLTPRNLRFARQVGAEAIVVHMTDYRPGGEARDSFDQDARGLDVSDQRGRLWSVDELRGIRELVESHGLRLAALENFCPAFWDDVIHDGPRRDEQLGGLRELVSRAGQAGICTIGYNFSLAGVWGHVDGAFARGSASTVAYLGPEGPAETPLPRGMVQNRVTDPARLNEPATPCSEAQFWARWQRFIDAVLPAAEAAGVTLAAHPDDPPVETLRGMPRLVRRPADFARRLDAAPSPRNKVLLCAGTLAEMPGADVVATAGELAARDGIAYAHIRNVRGAVPRYTEDFIDEGDIDVAALLDALGDAGFDGAMTPDHTPRPDCGDAWHAGMAHALGWLRGARAALRHNAAAAVAAR
jgi:mannonate dehydratase